MNIPPELITTNPVNEVMLQVSLPLVIYLPQGVQFYSMSYLPIFTLSREAGGVDIPA